MFSEIPRQSEHFNISQYLININICKFTDNLIEQCTLNTQTSRIRALSSGGCP